MEKTQLEEDYGKGSFLQHRLTGEYFIVVDANFKCKVPEFELKRVNDNNKLVGKSVFVYGSQIADYCFW